MMTITVDVDNQWCQAMVTMVTMLVIMIVTINEGVEES